MSTPYLLTAAPFSCSSSRIGLLGLAGVLAARRAGATARPGRYRTRTAGVGLIVAVIVLDIAAQSIGVLGQARVFALRVRHAVG
ncbi:hypothetical protein AB0L14_24770 [Streptomyces sp. NPDC052727]|uniref:hypothetical protein n=1 Tax=Streptomyces sp. NPDC052727 TaxID=3154854 RepID=UPI00342E4847